MRILPWGKLIASFFLLPARVRFEHIKLTLPRTSRIITQMADNAGNQMQSAMGPVHKRRTHSKQHQSEGKRANKDKAEIAAPTSAILHLTTSPDYS